MEDQASLNELRRDFLEEARFLVLQCEESLMRLEASPASAEDWNTVSRCAHSLKGAGAAVGFTDLASFAHLVEDALANLRGEAQRAESCDLSILLEAVDALKSRVERLHAGEAGVWENAALVEKLKNHRATVPPDSNGPPASPSEDRSPVSDRGVDDVKIRPERIEGVLDLVGELVVLKTQLLNAEPIAHSTDLRLNSLVGLLDKTVREIYDRALSMRMTALKPVFVRVQRAVRDLSVKLGKPVDFTMTGESTEMDRTMIELLGDPLIHIARNALDHGIEPPGERGEKPGRARITAAARQSGSRVVIEISDDGAGIDRDKVLRVAVEKGLRLPKDAAALSDAEVYQLLFLPGFSTASEVTDISGRGVGLDVVKSNVERLRGSIEIESRRGEGTLFRLSLPLTTAISDGLVLVIGERRYILPLSSIREILEVETRALLPLHGGQSLVRVRDRVLPLYPLTEMLTSRPGVPREKERERQTLALVEAEGKDVALRIDGVAGQSQFVIKSLAAHLEPKAGVVGAAILGDGTTALVLDAEALVRALVEERRGGKAAA